MKPDGQLPLVLGLPVQSVATPLQTFGCGPTSPWHTTAPPLQAVTPALHGGVGPPTGKGEPRSGISGVQGAPPVTPTRMSEPRLLSMVPSQSSSMPLHISVVGPTCWVQVRLLVPVPAMPLH